MPTLLPGSTRYLYSHTIISYDINAQIQGTSEFGGILYAPLLCIEYVICTVVCHTSEKSGIYACRTCSWYQVFIYVSVCIPPNHTKDHGISDAGVPHSVVVRSFPVSAEGKRVVSTNVKCEYTLCVQYVVAKLSILFVLIYMHKQHSMKV